MSRFILALQCFFAVLLHRTLSLRLMKQVLPPEQLLSQLQLAPAKDVAEAPPPRQLEPVQTAPPAPVAAPQKTPEPAPIAEPQAHGGQGVHRGAVQLLAVLQREGRLLDFVMEDIDGYADAQIGAAVRDIHRGCRKALGEHMKVRPIRAEPDEAVVRIPEGYDPSRIRLVGRVTGRPPFEGTLRHHGWCTGDINLSDIPAGHDPTVICPAEVELGA